MLEFRNLYKNNITSQLYLSAKKRYLYYTIMINIDIVCVITVTNTNVM